MMRVSLSEHLEEQIVSGRLGAGTMLPSERQLAEQFGVGWPLVREAMRSQVERSLVEALPSRGACVRHARTIDAAHRLDGLVRQRHTTPRDLVEARAMLECTASSLAAERATLTNLDALQRTLAELDRSVGPLEQVRADLAYHPPIARTARNPVVETMFGAIAL